MASLLNNLEGMEVGAVTYDQGYLTLQFSDGQSGITITSDFSLSGLSTIQDMTRLVVEKIIESESMIDVVFKGGASLRIDLREQAQHGPEVLTAHIPGYPQIVIN